MAAISQTAQVSLNGSFLTRLRAGNRSAVVERGNAGPQAMGELFLLETLGAESLDAPPEAGGVTAAAKVLNV
jgi:hypothetical protein